MTLENLVDLPKPDGAYITEDLANQMQRFLLRVIGESPDTLDKLVHLYASDPELIRASFLSYPLAMTHGEKIMDVYRPLHSNKLRESMVKFSPVERQALLWAQAEHLIGTVLKRAVAGNFREVIEDIYLKGTPPIREGLKSYAAAHREIGKTGSPYIRRYEFFESLFDKSPVPEEVLAGPMRWVG